MVATRKGPSAPAPSMRSNSTQSLPRSSSSKESANKRTTNSSQNGHLSSSNSTSKKKIPSKNCRNKWSRGFFSNLSLILLQCLALYAILTCPSQRNSNTPLCRSVRLYKTSILDPYVLPPIYSALSHPSAQPYVQRAHLIQKQVEPYVIKSVQAAQPVAELLGTLALKGKQIVWDGIVVPQFFKHIAPQYQTHLAPHVEKVILLYNTNISPYVDRARTNAIGVYNTVQPYVARAYSILKPLCLQAWLRIKPQLVKLLKLTKPILQELWKQALKGLGVVARQVGDARRNYVDPHLATIWVKVAELSRNRASSSSVVEEPTPVVSEPASAVSPTLSDSASDSSSSSLSTSANTEEVESSSTQSEFTPTSSITETSIQSDEQSSIEPSFVPSVDSDSSSVLTTTTTASSQATTGSSSADEIAAGSEVVADARGSISISSAVIDESTVEIAENSIEPSPSDASSPQPTVDDAVDVDFDDLFGDLDVEEAVAQETVAAPAEETTLSKEEEEEKLRRKKEATAAKRRQIMDRHTEWEEKLQDYMETNKNGIREALKSHRQSHLQVLVGHYEDGKETTGSIIRNLVDGTVLEGERLLTGLEAYMKKAAKSAGAPDFNPAAQLKKWDAAVDRVKSKFEGALQQAQQGIFDWYSTMRSWEIQLVLDVEKAAVQLGTDAQLDLGLDYTWLDDVTYKDWHRYHDLVKSAKRFGEEIRTIQNGTHPSPLEDPISEAMQSLQGEVEEIIEGFQAAWKRIHLLGIETFSPSEPPASSEQHNLQPEEPAVETQEPVLPISPPRDSDDGLKQTHPDALIGRTAEEVMEAAERAGAHMEL